MHLKSLTLRGFKSFASTTTLRFEPGITCVVGPNGSGKSNVVDALSWVMGEQGAKSLRGGKMEDVIFAGTTGRPPLGRAEVSLTIDNSDGALPIDYAEVTLTRIMFRGGSSEYQINGDTCRLLDFQELLSDSGIGREMHVIVGQGRLDSVLHADPMGRRAFVEEAAGVLKHRKRKEKALRKLDAMRANLARVQDLTDELRRQLKPLGRQAAVARRAAVIQAELRDARLRLLADDLVTLRAALGAELADEAALRERKESAEARLARALHREERLEETVRDLAPRLQRAQQSWYELSQLAERVRGTESLARERVRSASAPAQEERRGRDPQELEQEAAQVREQEAALTAARETAAGTLEEAVGHRAERERSLDEEERRLRDAARAVADRREELARLTGALGAARSRAGAAQAETGRLAAARDESRSRAARAREEYEALAAEVGPLDGDGDEDAARSARWEEARTGLAAAESALTAARDAVVAAERSRAAVSARREALAPGLRRKDGTGALLAARDRSAGVLGPAALRLSVTPGYEAAVAAALGSAADAVTVASPAAALEAVRHLRETDGGRATLLITPPPVPPQPVAPPPGGLPAQGAAPHPDAAHPTAPVPAGQGPGPGPGPAVARAAVPCGTTAPAPAAPVVRFVQGDAAVLRAVAWLLRDHVVVGTLDEAEALVAERPGTVAVTLLGDVFGAHLAQGGSAGAPSLIEVRAAVDEAAGELARLDGECRELTRAQESALAAHRELAARVEELAERRRAGERARAGAAQRLGALAGQAKGAAGEAERGAAAAVRAQEALERAVTEVEECAGRLATAEEMPVEEEPDTSRRDRLAAAGAAARQAEMEARLQLRTDEERVRALAGRADSLDRAARAEREARSRAERRRAGLRHEAEVAAAVADGARQLLAHVEVSLERAAAERTGAEEARGVRERELGEARARGRELAGELEELTGHVHRGEVLGAEKRLRIEALEARALEEFGLEPAGLVAEYGPDRPVPSGPPEDGTAGPAGPGGAEGGGAPQDPDGPGAPSAPFVRARQEERLRAAERAYQQLGKVNPLALEEFAALEERHRFLAEQLGDLRRTRTDLLQVVKEVDARVEQVFTEAYRDTAREFEGVFSRLFPGGEGRLVLTDPGDMLATGIDVEARPPGKKVKRLSLLSGGERSLTAVALLVAIFKARPSPFYVMDEVEAALDDTNLQRLIRLMEELQESSQLIVITHQKRTMEVADALYGVSMQGDGVSKVISQRLRRR
ncbi:AAA family ATPase [Streptomyces sp. NPDC051567]|uniref:AAA family ATPase n=1 Tax=Streptomyces sp. NPDC051567 TaxID=3365660 RepID=UPI00378DA78C